MNTIIFLLWFAEILRGLTFFLLVAGIVSLAVGAFIWMVNTDDDFHFSDEVRSQIKKLPKRCFIAAIVFFLCVVFLPTKNIIYIAMGLKLGENAAEKIVNSQKFDKLNQIIDLKLDEILGELQTKKGD